MYLTRFLSNGEEDITYRSAALGYSSIATIAYKLLSSFAVTSQGNLQTIALAIFLILILILILLGVLRKY